MVSCSGWASSSAFWWPWWRLRRMRSRNASSGQDSVAPPRRMTRTCLRSRFWRPLPQSHIVVDADDAALRASSITYAYGLVRQGVLREELADLAARARSAGAVSDLDLRLPRRERRCRAAPVGARHPIAGDKVLILFEDNTEKRRLEGTRRDFVANVSHELKTPVGAIGLLAETLTQVADEPDNVRRFSARLNAEAERLSQLVEIILAFPAAGCKRAR